MTNEELYNKLKPIQEARGYYFNPDKELALDVLEQLLALKDSLGYMPCPCRLSSGVREKDADILCPCTYRTEDVKEFGACYCGLYVDKEIADGQKKRRAIPDRRPADKILA